MAEVPAVPDADRLPWLTDDIRPAKRRRAGAAVYWGLTSVVLVASGSYLVGSRSPVQQPASHDSAALRSGPPAIPPEAAPPPILIDEAEPAPAHPVELAPRPAPARHRRAEPSEIAEPAPIAMPEAEPAAPDAEERAEADVVPAQPAVEEPPVRRTVAAAGREAAQPAARAPLRPWPAAQSSGAAGRMVRIGTYATRRQAKKAWWRLVRTYPGVGRLKAVVVPVASLRNGRTYYRLQFGTTSHAHSVVLCQRMRIVGQSCVPVGLPGEQSA